MVAFEAGGLKQRMTDVGGKALSGIKDTATTAVEKSKSVASEAGRLGSKAWERVKEGPVGMWVREKRANRLATKIDHQQQRVDELSSMIQRAGDHYASAVRLGQEQMMRVDKINKYAERRTELATRLSNHYKKKLEKPEERRRGIEDERKDAVSKRDVLVAKQKKYKDVFNRFRERQANLLGSRAYERSEEMASIAKSLSVMADQMKSLEEDIVTVDRVIEAANKDVTKWDADYSGTKRQIQHWSNTSLNGRHGTSAVRVREVAAQKQFAPETGMKAVDVPKAKVLGRAANDNEPVIPPNVKAETAERATGGEALQAFLQEVLREDLRGSLQKIVDKQQNKDVINGEKAKGGVAQFIELWKQVAEVGKPKVEGFSSAEIDKLKEHEGAISLIEFGMLISEKTAVPIEQVKNGVEKIAERWNNALEKQKQAA